MGSTEGGRDSGGLVPLRSGIAYIDGQAGELLYRGHNIHDIAERLSFEETVFLLWEGRLATMAEGREFADELATYRAVPEAIMDLLRITPEYAHPMAALRTAVSMLACVDPDQDEPGREAHELKAKKLVAQLPTIVAAQHRLGVGLEPLPTDPDLSHVANFLYMLSGRLPDELDCRVLNVLMNLYCEHELTSSTYTARLVIDARSDFYSAMVAALGALKGALQAGGLDDVMRMFVTIGSAGEADGYVEQRLATHGRVPGYGHRLYADRDPRTPHMKRLLAELATRHSRWYAIAEAIAASVERRTGAHPGIDFYSAPVLYHLGFPLELFTNVIAAARVGGWAAHVLEQHGDARLHRARADYVGPKVGL